MESWSTRPRPPAHRGTSLRGSVSIPAETATPPPSSVSALTALPTTPRTLQRRSRGGRVSLDYRGSTGSATLADPDDDLALDLGTTPEQPAHRHSHSQSDKTGEIIDSLPITSSATASPRHDSAVTHCRRSLNQPDRDSTGAAEAPKNPLTQRVDFSEKDVEPGPAARREAAEPSNAHSVVSADSARLPALAHDTTRPLSDCIVSSDGDAPPEAPAATYERLSRADLERLLGEADRIVREKEEELTIFTAAGQGLLDEYNALKEKHDSLRHRLPAELRSPTGSPVKQRQPRSSGLLTRSDSSPSQLRKESPQNGAGISTRPRADQQTDLWLTPTNTVTHDLRTPSGSPTSSRDVIKSGSISTSSKSGSAPNSRFLFSPSAAQAEEAVVLTQANYALTLQINEIQAESEAAEREGRKRLRRLERELQSLRADLERVEHRNAILESQAQSVKEKENELAKSARAIRVAPRKVLQPVTPDRPSYGRSPARTATASPGQQESPTRTRCSGILHREEVETDQNETSKDPALLRPFPKFSASQADSALHVVPSLSIYRTVSTSSLVPLPPPVRIDPSLEQQQDELVDQLIAKIDALQDTNYGFLSERETMFSRLAEVQEEMHDWKERCEELEDENQQHRLIGWRDAVESFDGSLAYDGPLANEEEDAHPAGSQAPSSRPDRSHTRRSMFRRLAADSNSVSLPSTGDFSDPVQSSSTRLFSGKMLNTDTVAAVALPTLQRGYSARHEGDMEDSVVICGEIDLADPDPGFDFRDCTLATCDETAVTTSDDVLRSGGLRWAGHPDADKYGALEQATAELAPDWQDRPRLSRAARRSRLCVAKERLQVSAGTTDHLVDFTSRASRESQSNLNRRRTGDRPTQSRSTKEQHTTRRRRALRRLSFEAEQRQMAFPPVQAGTLVRAGHDDSDAESIASSAWSEFDNAEHSLVHRSDYYPTSKTARYRRTILASMASDSAAQQIITFLTWIRFMAILTTAIIFAVWQGPRKTLSYVDGHRRRLQ